MSNCLLEKMVKPYHYPVMYREVLEFIQPAKRGVIVDCTTGLGGHSRKMLELMDADSFLIGLDRDQNSLEAARGNLEGLNRRFSLVKESFANIDRVLLNLGVKGVDAFLFDLGISTYQLNDPQRGFSFLKEGPLDMRMDQDAFVSAYDLINNLSEGELISIFRKFGEERHARRIANQIILARKKEPIVTTTQLARIIVSSISGKFQHSRIHPATRIFQSLRIAVNRELESLKDGLEKSLDFLNKGGRIAVISFHSLEDRIVKNVFRDRASQRGLSIITKKPLSPADPEKEDNPASRSAKLRVAEKIR